MWVQFLGQEDPLEKGMATHSSILARRIPWTEEPAGLLSMGGYNLWGRKELDTTKWLTLSLLVYLNAHISWKSSTLATSCKELTHWKRLWCWEGLGAGEEGDDRGWDGWMASLTRCTWVWVNSGSWWWTGRPGVLRFMGSQRVGHDWVTDLIWSDT